MNQLYKLQLYAKNVNIFNENPNLKLLLLYIKPKNSISIMKICEKLFEIFYIWEHVTYNYTTNNVSSKKEKTALRQSYIFIFYR